MSTRRLVIAAIVVTLATAVAAVVAGCGSGKGADLDAAKTAFTDRGVKFSFTIGPDKWRALQPALTTIGSDVPVDLRPHTVGYAASFKMPQFRVVYVFDSSSSAAQFAEVAQKLKPAGGAVLVGRDVVYVGVDDKLAHQAMASLRGT